MIEDRLESMVAGEQGLITQKPHNKFGPNEKIPFKIRLKAFKQKIEILLKDFLTKNDEFIQEYDSNVVILPMSQ